MKHTKNQTLAILAFLWISVCSFGQYDSIPHDGYDRTYLVHLPTAYDGSTDLPLVVAMHGGFGNAYNLENQSQLSVKADLENFIVVYPEGVKGGVLNISSWNAGWCCGFASNNSIDDVGFIDALLDTLIGQFAIDTTRVYATGMSNGGFMSYRLACELSDRIAAIAPVSASMAMASCNPGRAVPIIHFHSKLDTNVPYLGGVGNGTSGHHNSPVDSVLNVWSGHNNCPNLTDTIVNNSQYLHRKWSNCECGTTIEYYLTEDGGHSWHGGNQTAIGDPVSNYINATDLMWDFFQEHTLDCNQLSVSNDQLAENKVILFPNPTNEKFSIRITDKYQSLEVSIFTPLGQKVMSKQNQKEINISELAKGVYYVFIAIDGELKVEQVVKE